MKQLSLRNNQLKFKTPGKLPVCRFTEHSMQYTTTINTGKPKDLTQWDSGTLLGKNRGLVTDEPVEFEKQLVEAGDCGGITNRLEECIEEYTSNEGKKNRKMSITCNRLDVESLGS